MILELDAYEEDSRKHTVLSEAHDIAKMEFSRHELPEQIAKAEGALWEAEEALSKVKTLARARRMRLAALQFQLDTVNLLDRRGLAPGATFKDIYPDGSNC